MGIEVKPPPKLNRAMIKTGTYVGNGVDNRNIDIGVDLAAKDNVYVIINHPSNVAKKNRIEYGQGDLTMDFGSGPDAANLIQAFTSTGFQIGSDNIVNEVDVTFRYIAFWTEL
jgi:hypothetical protein